MLADVLINDFGIVNAINLDGGGSTTSVFDGKLVSLPSDLCTPGPDCECPSVFTTTNLTQCPAFCKAFRFVPIFCYGGTFCE
eukprot:m.463827 g.463827  ORF g.463827 m.463827 type:complete len:82 (+) comp57041_c0_seq4:161-406(+)